MTIKEDIKHIKDMANVIRHNSGGKSYYENYKDLSVADLLLVLEDENYHCEETIIEALVSLEFANIWEAIMITAHHYKMGYMTEELLARRTKLDKKLRERK